MGLPEKDKIVLLFYIFMIIACLVMNIEHVCLQYIIVTRHRVQIDTRLQGDVLHSR